MNDIKWTAEEVAKAITGKIVGNRDWIADSVSINSRDIESGALFIALKGENFDGHSFVTDAFSKGAIAAIVSALPESMPDDKSCVVVANTEKALTLLGKYRRDTLDNSCTKLIGVTGSVGKTSVKEMLSVAFSALDNSYATRGNLNNHLGTPLSLSRIPEGTEYAVMEMGMNHAGEIAVLTKLVRPHVAIITNVEAVHLEFFGSIEKIAAAKAEIFLGLEPDGTAILNKDNASYTQLLEAAEKADVKNIISFGDDAEADVKLIFYEVTKNGGNVTASVNGALLHYTLTVAGKHQAINSLAVLAAVDALGGNVQKAAEAIGGYKAPQGRGELVTIKASFGEFTIIDDCYNAGPISMRAAFDTVPSDGEGRVIAVLADMLELGDAADELHTDLANDLEQSAIYKVFTIGSHMQKLAEKLSPEKKSGHYATIQDGMDAICSSVVAGDTILIKGSNGMKLRQLVDALKLMQTQEAIAG